MKNPTQTNNAHKNKTTDIGDKNAKFSNISDIANKAIAAIKKTANQTKPLTKLTFCFQILSYKTPLIFKFY